MNKPTKKYTLTISCEDTLGIVSAVAGCLTDQDCFILESSHFGDVLTGRFFMRTVFTPGHETYTRKDFKKAFDPIEEKFGMEVALFDEDILPRVLIMVSRFDHCLNDLLYRYRTGALKMTIPAIVSNHMDLSGLAATHKIPFIHIPVTKETKAHAEERLLEVVEDTRSDLVVLARYMQVLSDDLSKELAGRCINIHHSFLPSFKGAKPYHRAFERGVKLIGATAHYVTTDLDEGPIIEQRVERVDHSQSVKDFIAVGRDVEALTLSRAIKAHIEHRVFPNGTRTVVFS
jgi:formyltetrahydrofolate deformylase